MPGPIDRLRVDPVIRTAHDVLRDGLPGSDLRSLLLDVASERAADRTPSAVLEQYRTDRFCTPSPIDAVAIATAEAAALQAVSSAFRAIQLSPVSPLATSSAMSQVPQNNVVTTMRLTEVLSDPTNMLALEAALERRVNDASTVRLAAKHRVLRAQRFDGPRSFAHFSLLGMVSAGRDQGDRSFEVAELIRHIQSLVAAVIAIDAAAEVVVQVSDHSGRFDEAQVIVDELDVEATVDPDRTHGRGYYEHLCFKIGVRRHDEIVEVGDGGSTSWTQHLLADRKERLVISGSGLDRIVM
jgi:hypothetical protein